MHNIRGPERIAPHKLARPCCLTHLGICRQINERLTTSTATASRLDLQQAQPNPTLRLRPTSCRDKTCAVGLFQGRPAVRVPRDSKTWMTTIGVYLGVLGVASRVVRLYENAVSSECVAFV